MGGQIIRGIFNGIIHIQRRRFQTIGTRQKQFDTLQERIAHVQLTNSTGIRDNRLPSKPGVRIQRAINCFPEPLPSTIHSRRATAVTSLTINRQPRIQIYRIGRPTHIGQQFINDLVIFKPFGSRTEPDQITGIRTMQSFGRRGRIHLQIARHRSLSPKVRHITEYPFFPIKTIMIFPCLFSTPNPFRIIVSQIDNNHFIIGNPTQQSLQASLVPKIVLISESPALRYPNSIGIAGRNRMIYRFAVLCQ